MNGLTTVDSIMKWLEEQVGNDQPIGPAEFMDIAFRLNALLQKEQEILFGMEQQEAIKKGVLLDAGKSVAYARSKVEETDTYKQMKIQKSKVERAIELVRIAKQNARLSSDLLKGQL